MTVGRICSREVDLIERDALVAVAAQRMTARNVGTLLVVDGQGHVAGLVTDRDLALRVLGERRDPLLTCVEDVMTLQPSTIREDCSVEDALAAMRVRGVRRLPVVDAAGVLTGVVSVDDVLRLLAKEFGEMGDLVEGSSPRLLARGAAH